MTKWCVTTQIVLKTSLKPAYPRDAPKNHPEGMLSIFVKAPFSIDQIDSLQKETNTNINELKKILATEISKLCHGSLAANSALKTAEATFESGVFGSDLPKITIDKVRFNKGIPAFQLFYEAGLTESGGEARRLIKNGGGKINNQIIFHETEKITEANANEKGLIKLSAGKKRHLIIQIK